ncbi:hypothetical protein [Micromonospora craniellae]|uniref:Uncharacterized protein n=1 Tax=Micromonospora craniellae TaxID=2294034 RepID=A0A372G5J2_9ACTN|nr:hypothetical protein [Micromonospora craniellae]QOC90311.1 hypothetical protein ID554_19235 [Micromonospora craniellae]RFS48297.1 hypothetical protein D0Q02_02100 [Micromonospora craniellae]
MVEAPIPNLHGTPMHVTAVELYQGHHGDAAGACVRCGERVPCPVRKHAASVIAAAGEDPRWYDGRVGAAPPPPAAGPAPRESGRTHPNHTGYTIGGHGASLSPESFLYEREREP